MLGFLVPIAIAGSGQTGRPSWSTADVEGPGVGGTSTTPAPSRANGLSRLLRGLSFLLFLLVMTGGMVVLSRGKHGSTNTSIGDGQMADDKWFGMRKSLTTTTISGVSMSRRCSKPAGLPCQSRCKGHWDLPLSPSLNHSGGPQWSGCRHQRVQAWLQ